jgi:hypothetical protein
MSAIFLGNMAFEETTGSVINVDAWGFDTITRKVNGKSTAGVAYIATLARKRTIRDIDYPNLFLVDYSASLDGAVWNVTLTYKGILGSSVPTEPVVESGYRVQQITLPFFGSEATGINATFELTVPWSRFEYYCPTKPSQPLYRGQVQVTKDSLQIMGRSGAAGNLVIFAGKFLNTGVPGVVAGSTIAENLNSYNAVAESFTTQFDRVPVGQWWRVTENNEVVIQPLDLAQAGYTAQLGIG